MSKLLAVLFACCALAPASAAPPPPPFVYPSLVTDVTNGVNIDIRINDLPLTRHELAQITPVPDNHIAIPPYYWKNGDNTISIRYVTDPKSYPTVTIKLDIAIVQDQRVIARLDPTTFTGCDSGDFEKRCDLKATFKLAGAATWAWTKSAKITDTPANRRSLRAAYVAFHKRLQDLVPRDSNDNPLPGKASKAKLAAFRTSLMSSMGDLARSAKLQPITEIDELLILASHPKSHLDYLRLDDPDTALEIVGDGTHARLWMRRIPLLWFAGGVHDARAGSGMMGPFSIGFDLWFRLVDGKWVPSAIWRTDPMVTLP